MGSISIGATVVNVLQLVLIRNRDDIHDWRFGVFYLIVLGLNVLFVIFGFVWLIAGSVWTFKAFRPDYANPNSEAFCDKGLYLTAFSLSVIFSSVALIVVPCGLCCGALALYCEIARPMRGL